MDAIGVTDRIATCHIYRVAHELHTDADACTFICYESMPARPPDWPGAVAIRDPPEMRRYGR
jgi:hypothetical protein